MNVSGKNPELPSNRHNPIKPKLGTVSNVKRLLEREHKDSTGSNESDEKEMRLDRKIGKVDTSFLENSGSGGGEEKKPKTINDPVISNVNAAKVKSQVPVIPLSTP